MRRQFLGLGLVAMIGLVTGCGGDTPVAFGSTGKPILEQLKKSIEQKDTKLVDRIITIVKGNREKGNMSTDEQNAVVKICEYMKAGNWEAAQKLLDGCMTETGKTVGSTATGNK